MSELVPEGHDVVVVSSRPAEAGRRRFELESGEKVSLPDDLTHESELIAHMAGAGYRLAMVGGGSRPDELRRFYFRPA